MIWATHVAHLRETRHVYKVFCPCVRETKVWRVSLEGYLFVYIYIYIYIYMFVCVCVCVFTEP